MYINIKNFNSVINALEKAFHKHIFNNNDKDNLNNEEIKEYGKDFYECLINEESEDYIFYLEKLVKLGNSIDGILTKFKIIY